MRRCSKLLSFSQRSMMHLLVCSPTMVRDALIPFGPPLPTYPPPSFFSYFYHRHCRLTFFRNKVLSYKPAIVVVGLEIRTHTLIFAASTVRLCTLRTFQTPRLRLSYNISNARLVETVQALTQIATHGYSHLILVNIHTYCSSLEAVWL